MQTRFRRAMMGALGSMVIAIAGTATGQTLVGDTVSMWSQPQASGVAVLDGFAIVTSPLPEFSLVNGTTTTYTLNVEATSIRLDSRSTFFSPYVDTPFAPSYFEIRDLDFVGEPERFISGVNVTFSDQISVHDSAPLNWPGFSASNVSSTGNSVRISLGGYRFPRDSFVQIDLITAVPTPGSAALLATIGLLGSRRRRH